MPGAGIDIERLLAPIPGENPAGEDLRYSDVYERIKEARRSDDMLNMGDWQREVKRADWTQVVEVACEALAGRTKDIQIGVWLTEALVKKQGFAGLAAGLEIIEGLLRLYWDHVYPLPEEGDLEFRSAPLEFLNDKVALSVRDVPVTDERVTEAFSWYKWQESRQVGYEKDTKNQWGDTDETKLRIRNEHIAEGRIPAEAFDAAVAKSSREFYTKLSDDLNACIEAFTSLDATVDALFGREAPRLSDLKKAIEDCSVLVGGFLKDKGGREERPKASHEPAARAPAGDAGTTPAPAAPWGAQQADPTPAPPSGTAGAAAPAPFAAPPVLLADQTAYEDALWQTAQDTLVSSGINPALAQLLAASSSAPSPRQKHRYRLLMAKLALTADRPDIARPIVEELYGLIGELTLERWESPLWIAEVIEAYYRCLTSEGASDDDRAKADNELFPKLCSLDITKALAYKKGG